MSWRKSRASLPCKKSKASISWTESTNVTEEVPGVGVSKKVRATSVMEKVQGISVIEKVHGISVLRKSSESVSWRKSECIFLNANNADVNNLYSTYSSPAKMIAEIVVNVCVKLKSRLQILKQRPV